MVAKTSERHSLEFLSAQEYRALVEAIADFAIYMLDPRGNIISWNLGAERFKGYQADEVLGKHFSMFYTEEDRAVELPQRALSIAHQDGRFEHEGWRLRKDGTRFWAHVIIDRITNDEGAVIGYAKITRDVTPQKEANEQLERAREALFQSQKLESIGKLTGGVAHDFNNLLMIIHSSLEMMEIKCEQPDQVVKLASHAKAAVKRGSALTQRMLAFARKQELRLEVIDLKDLIDGMTDMLQRSLGPRIRLTTNFPNALGQVSVDANQFELAVMNLAVNARDALPDGGNVTFSAHSVTIDRAHSTKLEPGDYVCVAISDDGIGMDEVTMGKATEPFFTTKGIGKGTGLGLSMVHGLLEQSGGRMVIKSSKGIGTRVELWLPSTKVDRVRDLKPPTTGNASLSLANNSLCVLVVDDDSLVRATTGVVLESLGHKVIEVSSAEEAIAVLEGVNDVDVLLTDHAMPGMTGAQLTNEANIRWPALPVVLASGYAEIQEDLSDGAIRLTKPYGRDDLIRAINEVLNKSVA
ncbi:PAS domain S-box protein [Dyella dinghuensis]|uniref:histidine kinase n=1 Tax=Dyella dinghuensis TaxID=1920169 RepID=A0A432LXM1_9GAMM|nr:PAS domain S-box protein [Dyella dinghuensis]RUL66052.1 PAS domain S-box protein [Dyella dinghuensis]